MVEGPECARNLLRAGPDGGQYELAVDEETVQFTERAKDVPKESVEAAQEAFDPVREAGEQVEYGGAVLQEEHGPTGSEAIGLAAAVLVLLVAFGSVFAMVVPLLTALFALALGMSVLNMVAGVTTIGTSGPVVAAMIGLGVGIDYALLVVTRHREGMRAGHSLRSPSRSRCRPRAGRCSWRAPR